jgi:hypothetical protein
VPEEPTTGEHATDEAQPTEGATDPPVSPPDDPGPAPATVGRPPTRRRRSDRRPESEEPPVDEATASGHANPAINITVTLTNEAAELLEQARQGSTVRETLVGAVRATSDELRARHPNIPDPSGAIPIVRIKSRRRLDGYGRKVPVRLYVVERDAIYALADDLGITVSSLVTEALELHYRDSSRQGRRGVP